MPAHLIAEEGPHQGLIFNLEEGEEWVIGRDSDVSNFCLEDTTVSRKHAELTKTAEGIYLKNLSRVNPTLVNEVEPEGDVLLAEGDRIQIGSTVFRFTETAAQQEEEEKTPPEPTSYDTIFEDAEEEEAPFNIMSQAPFLLKVISGPNAGAEIGIEKGRAYVIGKDPATCDIVFHDLAVSRGHARLTVSEEGVLEIEDLGSKNGTIVNGTPIAELTTVTPQDLISIGTTIFLIIDREAAQETIYSPITPAAETSPPVPAETAPEIVEEPPKRNWREDPIPTKYLVGGGALLITCFILLMTFFSLFKSHRLESDLKEPVSQIKEAVDKFKDVQFSFNPASGKLFLVGHVLTNVEDQELKFRIEEIPFVQSVENTVIIDEGVCKAMNDVLSENAQWRGMSIRAVEPGKFIATGYVQTTALLTQLSDYLTLNFPYLDRLDNQVVVVENLYAQLEGMLLSSGFGAVALQLSNGEVILSGRYNQKMEREYEKLLKEMNSLKGVAAVKNLAVPTTANQAAVDLTRQFQVSGAATHDGRGYSVILNGKIYTLGDSVDGLIITDIEPNTILLEKDGIKYKIDYTR